MAKEILGKLANAMDAERFEVQKGLYLELLFG
jgi:hypothetical protein